MALLTAKSLAKSFRGEFVLRGVVLTVNRGDRYGLVGPNGSGKSTLARMLAGTLESDEGDISLAKHARLVYLPQRPDLTPGRTVREEVLTAFDDLADMEGELRRLEREMARPDLDADGREAVLNRHGRLQSEFEARSGWDRERRVEASLAGLGVPEAIRDQDITTLSGGQATRVSLARSLLQDPDVLILDEPTNHLDISATEWLEGELVARKGACIVISHDRWFLERVATAILELEATRLHSYPGGYRKFEVLRWERRRREAREFEKQQEYIRKEEDFIRKNIAAQNVSMARGKRTRLERLERIEAPSPEPSRMAIPDSEPDRSGGDVLVLEGLAVGIGGETLVSGLDLRIPRGQRLGIVGPNGCGKTTLLRALAGEIPPEGGRIERGHKLRVGYLPQEPTHLDPDRTALETVQAEMIYATAGECRSWLARFLFSGEEVEKRVGNLSGGEAARLALALLFLEKPNLLLLDEPTNHLDIPAREALEEALREFPGTIVIVSHDRYLLEGVADRILEFEDGRALVTDGNWTEHLRAREAVREGRTGRASAKRRPPGGGSESSSASSSSRPGKVRNPFRFERLEEEIIRTEKRIEEVHEAMAREEVYLDPERLAALKRELPELEEDLARLNAEWEEWIE